MFVNHTLYFICVNLYCCQVQVSVKIVIYTFLLDSNEEIRFRHSLIYSIFDIDHSTTRRYARRNVIIFVILKYVLINKIVLL